MPERLGDRDHVHAGTEQIAREGVAQIMDAYLTNPTPSTDVPADFPPPGMLDMDKVRFFAGHGQGRRNRPPYAIMGERHNVGD